MKNISEKNIVTELSNDHRYLNGNIASLVESSKNLSSGVVELNSKLSKKEIISYEVHQLIYLLLSNYLMISDIKISSNKPNKETTKLNNALDDAYKKITKIIESDKFIEFVKTNLMGENKNEDEITKKSLKNILKFIKAYKIKNDLTLIIEKSLELYEQDDAEEKEDRSRPLSSSSSYSSGSDSSSSSYLSSSDSSSSSDSESKYRSREKKKYNRRESEKQETANQGTREYRSRESEKQETANQRPRYAYLQKVLKGNQLFNKNLENKYRENKLTKKEPGKE